MSRPVRPATPHRSLAAGASPPEAPAGTQASWTVERFIGPLDPLQAQRLWVLERASSRSSDADVCRFAGAVLILWADGVYGVIVRSPERARASDVPLREGRLRLSLGRDAFKFANLTDAVAGMEDAKRALLRRGWAADLNDAGW